MQTYNWDAIEKEQLNPLFARRVIHAETMTIARVYLKQGCLVPEHSHANEQVSVMLEGRLRFVLAGKEVVVGPGDILRIPPNVPHSAEAIEDTVAMDLFSPVREDWVRGDDAYLRK